MFWVSDRISSSIAHLCSYFLLKIVGMFEGDVARKERSNSISKASNGSIRTERSNSLTKSSGYGTLSTDQTEHGSVDSDEVCS